jgi:ATP phosphoribosyltransferase regulatory subunit
MNKTPSIHPALLPSGLRDVLPPDAEVEALTVEAIMECFAAHGYQRVKPPMMEFEDSLFAGSGAATAEQTFRLMDPESQRMMGVRADTTPQIARIANTRLASAPRPLRLAYAGQCLRVRGAYFQPERQIAQAGIELIGADTALADAEIILTAIEALASVGLHDLSVDLTMPRLVPGVLKASGTEGDAELALALARKDAAAVTALAGTAAPALLAMLEACGPAERALAALHDARLPAGTADHVSRLAETVKAIHAVRPDLPLTVDPVEYRGYQYHTGLCMTIFAVGRQAELGRGGRYLSGDSEPATGITLYPDTIIQIAPSPALRPRVYLPGGTPPEAAAQCRQQGYATIPGLAPVADVQAEAARLGCSHVFTNGAIAPLA